MYNNGIQSRITNYELMKSLSNKKVQKISQVPAEILIQSLTALRASINSVQRDIHHPFFSHMVKLAKSYNSLLQYLPTDLDHDFTPIIF